MNQKSVLEVEIVGGVALLGLNSAPVNALGQSVRQELQANLTAAEANPAVKIIALYGCGRGFSAGADIREFGMPPQQPDLPGLINQIEASKTPVVAILHGFALGGGLELALAAHLRVGLPGLKLGLPEVTLGLLPGAGGTQRLPRLIGIEAAIDVISTGRQISAEDALSLGLLEQVVDQPPRDAAMAMAQAVLHGKITTRRTSELTVEVSEDVLKLACARIAAKRPALAAPLKAVEAISRASLPLAEGLAFERNAFLQLMQGPDRQGLIHAFEAERAVKRIPETSAAAREIQSSGVIGGGTMGVGIATALLQAAIPVILIETAPERAEAARNAVVRNFEGAVTRGKLTENESNTLLSNLTVSTTLLDLREVDIVIEAAFEELAVKTEIFAKLDRICKAGAVLGSNTSYLDVNLIAAATSRPQDVIGLHFFSPAHVMRLLELVVAKKTAPEVVATGLALAQRMKKVAVRSGVCDGFIGNRILAHYRKVADYMLLDGADFEQIDAALEGFGFAMGPFATGDLAGLDIGWAMRKRKAATRPVSERYVAISDRICEAGHFGRKSGLGYYDYRDTSSRFPSAEAQAHVLAERRAEGIKPRSFKDEDIVARYMISMISEAARVVEEGIALRPIDVDAVLLFGYGFPRHLGGPLNYADRLGAKALVAQITAYALEDPHYWQVPRLIQELADSNGCFSDLNKE